MTVEEMTREQVLRVLTLRSAGKPCGCNISTQILLFALNKKMMALPPGVL